MAAVVPTPATEPVAYTELVRLVLAAAISVGWITIDDDRINIVASAAGLVISLVLSWLARARVTPVVVTPAVVVVTPIGDDL